MPWRPNVPGEVPTLGHLVIEWIEGLLAAPDRMVYEPFQLYEEQVDFLHRFYALDPRTCKRIYRRGVYSRSRGAGKSPFMGAVSLVEALGPVVPAGWDGNGQPVGKPWREVRTVVVHIMAVSEKQTANTWTPLLEMCSGPLVDFYPGLEPLDTFVNLPGPRGSKIEPITSSARTIKGARPVFSVLDQTEEWVPGNGGPNLLQKAKNNAAKVGGHFIETPNAYIPGEKSVAEDTALYWQTIKEGRARDTGLYYDHREAPPETDMADRESLVAGLRYAYGDSSGDPRGCVIHTPSCPPGHVDLDFLVATIWDPTSDPQVSKSDFLNQITHASDAFLSSPQWAACGPQPDADHKVVADKDIVTLGFDGSRGRAQGKPDATALIGCRVSDGHLFQIAVWEAPDNKEAWASWEPPIIEVEAALAECFRKYRVATFYADPAKDWRSHVNAWEARYGKETLVQSKRQHPFEWWMIGGRSGLVQIAIQQFEGAVLNGDMTHDGSWALTRHMLAARRRIVHGKLALAKESDYSMHKVDAAVAAVLAWQGRLDAITAGVLTKTKKRGTRMQRIY